MCGIRRPMYIGLHDDQRRPYTISKGCSLCNTATIASEKPTQGCQGIMSTLVTSGDLVRPLSNNDAACYDSSSSLVKHPSQKRPAFMFASPLCEK